MTDKEFRRILSEAVAGNEDALVDIIELYLPLINRYSIVEGELDEDLRQAILLRIYEKIKKFVV